MYEHHITKTHKTQKYSDSHRWHVSCNWLVLHFLWPVHIWNFYIGGYQPAQKWLKDRKGRELSFDDIFHYQKIIVALNETDRIMKEIDKVITF